MTLYFSYDIFIAHPDFKPLQNKYFYHPPFIYHAFFKSNKIYAIVLCLILLKQLKAYTLNLQNNFSYIEKVRFKWLKYYTIGLALVYFFSLVAFLSYNIGLIENIENVYIALNAFIIVIYLYLSFHGVRYRGLETMPQQVDFFNRESACQEPNPNAVQVNKQYLRDNKSQEIYEEIFTLLDIFK